MLTTFLQTFVYYLIQILVIAIVARALLSWFNLRADNPLVVLLYDVTEPILAPLRRIIPQIGMIDISPLVAILLLQVMQQLISSIIR